MMQDPWKFFKHTTPKENWHFTCAVFFPPLVTMLRELVGYWNACKKVAFQTSGFCSVIWRSDDGLNLGRPRHSCRQGRAPGRGPPGPPQPPGRWPTPTSPPPRRVSPATCERSESAVAPREEITEGQELFLKRSLGTDLEHETLIDHLTSQDLVRLDCVFYNGWILKRIVKRPVSRKDQGQEISFA